MAGEPPDSLPRTSVLGTLESRRAAIEPFLEPGEQLQVVVQARTGLAGWTFMAATSTPLVWVTKVGDVVVLAATDRNWLLLDQHGDPRDVPLRPRVRMARDIRPKTSMITRFNGFDREYAIDAEFDDHVQAANDALDAMQAGRPWRLEATDQNTRPAHDVTSTTVRGLYKVAARVLPPNPFRRRGRRR